MSLEVVLRYRTRKPWAPGPGPLRAWARLAAGRRRGELGIRIVDRAESRALNRRYRGHDAATNVLSFPVSPEPGPHHRLLGDLVVCAPLVASEAGAQHKPLRAHWAHLVIHGTLHLLGFDHAREPDAQRMERRERMLLARLGYADPYGG
ncbi:MAG: rRNA maturation RNase YbeY [Gammaproteobacteria bacterium]|nr:MAG: rRNA maturation RNase YbeY [Gammaproteobacteria bacterium]